MPPSATSTTFTSWLETAGLGQHAETFTANAIDFDIAADLTEDDLKDLGLTAIGDRKRFLKALRERGGGGDAEPAAEALAGERRQVTVLFADIAGYTALSSQRDAEDVHTLLSAYFDIADGAIRNHGGTIDKHIGDAVMAVFGAPVAHTDDPLRAILAALEIHSRLAELSEPIQVHIGIASGEVVASGTGSDAYREYTVTGSTVNLASRLDGLAGNGETYVNDAVYEAVAASVVGQHKGEFEVKGFDTPVSVWSIEGRRTGGAVAAMTEICGREQERAVFEGATTACRENGAGQVFYLRGEPGIGKSRLAEAFREIANDNGFACHEAMILDFGSATGRESLRTIANGVAEFNTAETAEAAIAKLINSASGTVPNAAHFFDLLDIPQPDHLRTVYDAMDNETRRRGRHEALALLIRQASRNRPRFIWVDNLHWADERSLTLFRTQAEIARDHPLLVVYTTRIDGDPWPDGVPAMSEDDCATITLETLDTDAAQAMGYAHGVNDDHLIAQCLERAGGNPLFLEQLFRSASDGVQDSLPATVQSVVLTRMDGLDSADRKALQAASIMGQQFSLDVLRTLIGDPAYECDELISRALVRPITGGYLFAHALVADGAYASMLTSHRRALHVEVAAWYADKDAVLHAQHLDRADRPEAVRAYLAAAAGEVAAYRYEPALQFTARGLELATLTEDRVALLCQKGDTLLSIGQTDAATEVFREAMDLADTPVCQVRAHIGAAAAARMAGAVDDGLNVLETAEDIADQVSDDLALAVERAQIFYYRGTFLFSRGDLDGGLAAQERSIQSARDAGDRQWEARGLSGLGDAQYAYGRMQAAHASFLQCLEICQTDGYGQIEVANRYMDANMRRYVLEFRDGLVRMSQAVELARQVGNSRAEMLASLLRGELLTDAADYDEALDSLSNALEIILGFGNFRMAAYIINHQARALAGAGRMSEARQAIEQAWKHSRETDTAFIGARICGSRALLATDAPARTTALADGEAIIAGGVLAHNVIWFLRDAIDASLAAGDGEAAHGYAGRLEETTRQETIPWCDLFIARGRALAAHLNGISDPAQLAELAEQTRKTGLLIALPAIEQALSDARSNRT